MHIPLEVAANPHRACELWRSIHFDIPRSPDLGDCRSPLILAAMTPDLTPLLLAAIPMFGWGLIQLLAARLSRAVGYMLAGLLVQAGGLAGTLLLAPMFLQVPASVNWFGLIFLGVSGLIFYLLLYRALGAAEVSLVAPIVSSWGLITALMGIAVAGDSVTLLKVVCMLAITAGIVLLSVNWASLQRVSATRLMPGIGPALAVALGWGVTYYYLKPLNEQMGWYFTTVGTRSFTVLAFLPLALLRGGDLRHGLGKVPWALALGIVVLDIFAFTSYNYALTRYEVSLVSIIASASPLVSVLGAWLLLRERLTTPQRIGVAVVIVGILGMQIR
jgi:drug/metabolite transporter (DMT)-like permease